MAERVYFAYGSNMHPALLGQRLHRPDPVSFRRRRGVLRNYALSFDKLSSRDARVGYANVNPQVGEEVEGILNDLSENELLALDGIELVPRHYTRAELIVHEAETGRPVAASVYLANPAMVRIGLLPTRGYLERLLGGADLLSQAYVARLNSLACHEEPEAL